MKLNSKLSGFINELSKVKWFSNCGKLSEKEYKDISVLKSWAEAKRIYKTKKWEKFITATSNRTVDILWEQGLREDELNKRGDEVLECVEYVLKEFSLFETVGADDSLKWKIELDLRVMLTEVNTSELVPPLFGLPVVWPWYKQGNLPCGWDGKMISEDWNGNSYKELPEGKLRVL